MPPSPHPLATGLSGSWRTARDQPIPVLVVSRHRLVGDAVATALSSLGFAADPVGVPIGAHQLRELSDRIVRTRPEAGVVVTELHDAGRLRDTAALTARTPLSWVVLTDVGSRAVHETLLQSGAQAVLPSGAGLGELREALLDAVAQPGRLVVEAPARASPGEEISVAMRLLALSSREMQILQELDLGHPVKVIAEDRGVTVGTVRGQVKSVLRKLGVTSQLQAVAIYRRINRWFAD